MLFRELIALYCENHMKYILWAECGVNVLKVGGTYSNHWALKGSIFLKIFLKYENM
jgi:hypothetical protein